MVSALKKKVLNYIVYVTNIGFPARLNKQKIKWKHLQKVIPVWNIAITFHSNQNHCLLSILRPVVGKTAGWKLKANLWKTVVKRCIVYIWTFVKWIMKHKKETKPFQKPLDFIYTLVLRPEGSYSHSYADLAVPGLSWCPPTHESLFLKSLEMPLVGKLILYHPTLCFVKYYSFRLFELLLFHNKSTVNPVPIPIAIWWITFSGFHYKCVIKGYCRDWGVLK